MFDRAEHRTRCFREVQIAIFIASNCNGITSRIQPFTTPTIKTALETWRQKRQISWTEIISERKWSLEDIWLMEAKVLFEFQNYIREELRYLLIFPVLVYILDELMILKLKRQLDRRMENSQINQNLKKSSKIFHNLLVWLIFCE